MKCLRHPKEDTQLSCNKCGVPICPRCAVSTPVGYKCPVCARPDRTTHDLPIALVIRCLALTVSVASLAGFVVNSMGFFFIGILAYGWVVGEVAFASSSRRAGPFVEGIAIASVILGLLLSNAAIEASPGGIGLTHLADALGLTDPFLIVGMIVASIIAVGRVRYR